MGGLLAVQALSTTWTPQAWGGNSVTAIDENKEIELKDGKKVTIKFRHDINGKGGSTGPETDGGFELYLAVPGYNEVRTRPIRVNAATVDEALELLLNRSQVDDPIIKELGTTETPQGQLLRQWLDENIKQAKSAGAVARARKTSQDEVLPSIDPGKLDCQLGEDSMAYRESSLFFGNEDAGHDFEIADLCQTPDRKPGDSYVLCAGTHRCKYGSIAATFEAKVICHIPEKIGCGNVNYCARQALKIKMGRSVQSGKAGKGLEENEARNKVKSLVAPAD